MEEFARSSGLSNGRMGPVTQVQTRKDRRISQQPILSQKGQLFDLHLTHLRLQWEPPVPYESSYFSGCCNNNIFGPVIIKWCHLAGRKKRFKNVPCHAGLLSEGLNYRNRRNRWRSAIFFSSGSDVSWRGTIGNWGNKGPFTRSTWRQNGQQKQVIMGFSPLNYSKNHIGPTFRYRLVWWTGTCRAALHWNWFKIKSDKRGISESNFDVWWKADAI